MHALASSPEISVISSDERPHARAAEPIELPRAHGRKPRRSKLKAGFAEINRSAALGAAIVAIPAALAWLYPPAALDVAVLAGAQIAADATVAVRQGHRYTLGSAVRSSLLGTVITLPTDFMFGVINTYFPTATILDYVIKGAVWGGIAYPVYIAGYQFANFIIKEGRVTGALDYLRSYYGPVLKTALLTIFPLSLLNIFFVPPVLQVPITAGLGYGLALFGRIQPAPAEKEAASAASAATPSEPAPSVWQMIGSKLSAWVRKLLVRPKRWFGSAGASPAAAPAAG